MFRQPILNTSWFLYAFVFCLSTGFCDSCSAQTDPLGNPIKSKEKESTKAEQEKSNKTEQESATNPLGMATKNTEQSADELPELPASMLKGLGNLKDYKPEKAEYDSLPRSRSFNREGQTAAEMRQQESAKQKGQRLAEPLPDSADQPIAIQASTGEAKDADHGHFQLVKRSTQRWEFGMEISSPGNLRGAVASAPVPIEWDEQKITIVRSYKSPNVGSVKMKKFPGQGQQMIVSVPRLGPGEKATVILTMDLDRFDIVTPEDTQSLVLPEKGNRSARPYLGDSPYIETRHKRIQELADSIVNDEETAWNQALSIYDWVQQNIAYQFDPQIHSCLEALDAKKGDCEEVASLFIALCRAKGIPARAVWCNDHTYPEFMLCTKDGKDVWFPCQITTTEHMFGVMYDDRPILQKGDKFKILGEAAPFRYLKSAMIAKSATASPSFQWIIRKVESGADASPESSPLGGALPDRSPLTGSPQSGSPLGN